MVVTEMQKIRHVFRAKQRVFSARRGRSALVGAYVDRVATRFPVDVLGDIAQGGSRPAGDASDFAEVQVSALGRHEPFRLGLIVLCATTASEA